ncbi:Protein of unknown function [Meinhardsimonia xiamenensis]|jgi:hypothetical protein|uniref:Inner membrane protein YgaP-like transmembrane domain-containing protein n=1 Tax=Meinhardsimonia xiamenensis TaxID=990712 RepID=A0A1G9D3H0_9RHOB|nr:DUF2892 domain-containing protein [Meinhardsimonia xiamenensis]PRX38144.1 Protein of unknown function (DUF2892) [Meinhardsimonia xiamenensis]SDK58417.1 Protein of unknown function [Meinhardsimonia xiamenensis]
MSKNMGTVDRVVRAVIGLALLYWAFLSGAASANGLLLWLGVIVAVIMLITAAVGNCPLYRVFGIRTCKAE